jgi:multicomponent Na+:H+ antiporter subunit C
MELILAIVIGALVAAGIYRLLGGSRLDALVGILLLSQAANLIIFASGGLRHGAAPLLDGGSPLPTADPLPQALVLTAIVIGFGILCFVLILFQRQSPSEE